jgi:hypothetical protein
MSIGEIMGYVASVLLAISLLVNGELKFRWVNSFGCVAFIIYGILINAFPVTLTNVILLLINAFQLAKAYKAKEAFDLYEFTPGEKIIDKFLQFYDKDIHHYFPGFSLNNSENNIHFIVLRDMAIANIFVAQLTSDGTANVKINYTIPKFRDYKVGRFILDKEKQYLTSKGIKQIMYTSVANKSHLGFLKKMGFTDHQGGMIKPL